MKRTLLYLQKVVWAVLLGGTTVEASRWYFVGEPPDTVDIGFLYIWSLFFFLLKLTERSK